MEEVGVEALQLQPKRGKGLFWRSILRTMKRTASQSFPESQQPTYTAAVNLDLYVALDQLFCCGKHAGQRVSDMQTTT